MDNSLDTNDCIEVEYNCSTKNILYSYQYNGSSIMYANTHHSYFFKPDYPKLNIYPDLDAKSDGQGGFSSSIPIYGDKEGLPIYRNFESDSVWYVSNLYTGKIPVIIKDSSVQISWEITGEKKSILGYSCFKAIGRYFGRDYIAWFTPEIQIPAGPYMFYGCPGLILEVYSLDGNVHYTTSTIHENSTKISSLKAPSHLRTVTFEEFKTLVFDLLTEVKLKVPMATNFDPPKNTYIEQNKWTINSEFNEWWEKNNK